MNGGSWGLLFLVHGQNADNPRRTKELLLSYTGRADKFLLADALRQRDSLIKGTTPARNDFIDVSHLLYLELSEQIIVSDDGPLADTCRELFPNNYLPSQDLRAICERMRIDL